MAKRNLIKEIAKRVKETQCPIQKELQEQYEMTQNHRFFAKLRQTQSQTLEFAK